MNQKLQDLAERWPLADKIDIPDRAEILIVGAYTGITIEFLAHKFPNFKRILGFEPQEWAAREAMTRIKAAQLESIWIVNYALGDESRGLMTTVHLEEFGTDGCSFHNKRSTRQPGEALITEAAQVLPLFYPNDQMIDLCIMNCEGSEFELLPHFSRTGWDKKINRLAVQWHTGICPEFTDEAMDEQIAALEDSGFNTTVDERPSWTYHTR